MTRPAGSAMSFGNTVGPICHDHPYLSLSLPHLETKVQIRSSSPTKPPLLCISLNREGRRKCLRANEKGPRLESGAFSSRQGGATGFEPTTSRTRSKRSVLNYCTLVEELNVARRCEAQTTPSRRRTALIDEAIPGRGQGASRFQRPSSLVSRDSLGATGGRIAPFNVREFCAWPGISVLSNQH
jgi:hypothetical protein